jgi:superfamily II DNA/RNA helicase
MAPEIRRLADAFLQNPKEVTVSRPASVATTITEGLALVAEQDKREALRRLVRSEDVQNALIFCNRKRDVDILHKSLTRHGFSVGALHGDMAQPARFATLEKFKANEIRLLCCSDVAARGLDIGGLSHVFNFDVPMHAEDYVHRIGRTGRAGREGRAFTIAMPEDKQSVEAIEKLTGHGIPRVVIPGLDPVEWVEGDRRRGRGGRKPAAKPAEKPTSRGAPKSSARARPAEVPSESAPQPELPPMPEPRPERRPARTERPRDARPREERPREERPREERPRDERPRDDGPRDDRPRDRRDRRRDDDLGPSVLGFGDETPAFMLVTVRRRPEQAAQQDDMEA